MKRRCLAVIFILCLVLAACGGNKKTKDLKDVLPDFSSVLSQSDLTMSDSSEESLRKIYRNGTKEQYDKIVEICMSSGFDKDLRNVDFRDDFWRYDAYDTDEKYCIEIFWEDDEITILMNTVEKTE